MAFIRFGQSARSRSGGSLRWRSNNLGCKPENTAYIDDLAANIRSATEVGLKTVQYDLTKHAEFEQRLAEMGVQI